MLKRLCDAKSVFTIRTSAQSTFLSWVNELLTVPQPVENAVDNPGDSRTRSRQLQDAGRPESLTPAADANG